MSGIGMSFGMQARMEQRLSQIMSPRMIQAMKILQLPIQALQEKLQEEMQVNPVLELREPAPEVQRDGEADGLAPREADPSDPRRELVIDTKGDASDDFDRLASINDDWQNHFNEEQRPSSNRIEEETDRKNVAEANMAAREQSLQDYLADQLAYLDTSPSLLRLARHVITHIANSGYLGRVVKVENTRKKEKEKEKARSKPKTAEQELEEELEEDQNPEDYRFESFTLEDIAASYDLPVSPEEVEAALRLVQKLDPPGVGARDLRECLLLQITDETPHAEALRTIVQHHLEDVQHNRLPVIQKRTGYDIPSIHEALEELGRLNPRPGAQFVSQSNRYITPDLAVDLNDKEEYVVRLLDDWMPNVYISRRYLEMYRNKAADPTAREFLKKKIQAAQWLIEAIEQRRGTLLKVASAIIQHQRKFLDQGPEHIEPLKMQQIADQVGVHVTTVSRAVDDKWIQTPRGLFPLKRFFGGAKKVGDEEVAYEVIKQKLQEIIDHEDRASPLSDEDLVKKLTTAGYPIKRRTVTKYRKMLKIPSSRQRKVWTE